MGQSLANTFDVSHWKVRMYKKAKKWGIISRWSKLAPPMAM